MAADLIELTRKALRGRGYTAVPADERVHAHIYARDFDEYFITISWEKNRNDDQIYFKVELDGWKNCFICVYVPISSWSLPKIVEIEEKMTAFYNDFRREIVK